MCALIHKLKTSLHSNLAPVAICRSVKVSLDIWIHSNLLELLVTSQLWMIFSQQVFVFRQLGFVCTQLELIYSQSNDQCGADENCWGVWLTSRLSWMPNMPRNVVTPLIVVCMISQWGMIETVLNSGGRNNSMWWKKSRLNLNHSRIHIKKCDSVKHM